MAAYKKNQEEIAKAAKLAHVPGGEDYEKMISGMLYDAFVPELEVARLRARKWAMKYNTTFPDADTFDGVAKVRLSMLQEIIGHIDDEEAFIEPPFSIDYGCNISLGKRFYANFNLTILDCAIVTIGDRAVFGPNVSLLAATHETEVASRRQGVEYAKPITIGNDCWLGGHVVILPGVTIGDGCTIAASSVVTKDIPSWSVAMGAPARVVKKVQALK
ncbi:Acetyltransferase (isoleucine patch superfamily) [Geosmithia morbida]|uniref:Acetyltransferase (Isoleucine patch superfamily) n=1 Tax=Geosmithia morbida TaxID=1094350 RepID=A0A9P4YTI5_9HYPO|nr:Acetyltransferase (isoleucine patch superfamily) [Geosmithia morbida]KAF4121391.1 Acetyltransferase (isoleucine patch superfamily) [Geosmithia morbida]